MTIDLTFTLSTGGDYKQSTSDFPSIDACRQQLVGLVGHGAETITFTAPDGSMILLPSRHIVAVALTAAGD